jgi:predicted dehydrogenase
MTFDLDEALELRSLVKTSGKVFALTYNYTGYPMVKEVREIVCRGEMGKLLKIVTEYPQGWLLNPLETKGQEQAWRNDPVKAGPAGCLGDIGTHVEHLSRYITRLEIDELCADFTKFGAGKRLEDDANLLVHYKGGGARYHALFEHFGGRRKSTKYSRIRYSRLARMGSGTSE